MQNEALPFDGIGGGRKSLPIAQLNKVSIAKTLLSLLRKIESEELRSYP